MEEQRLGAVGADKNTDFWEPGIFHFTPAIWLYDKCLITQYLKEFTISRAETHKSMNHLVNLKRKLHT